MPPIETSERYEKAVLWEFAGVDNYGKTLIYPPEEITVRWEEAKGNPSSDRNGEPVFFDSTAYTDFEVTIGSILWRGALVDLPENPTNLKRVKDNEDTPDIKGRFRQYDITMERYTQKLPQIVGTGTGTGH